MKKVHSVAFVCAIALSVTFVFAPPSGAERMQIFEKPKNLDLPDTIVDVVLTQAWIYMQSGEQVLGRMNMCLRPDGRLVVPHMRLKPGESSIEFFTSTGTKTQEIKGLTHPRGGRQQRSGLRSQR